MTDEARAHREYQRRILAADKTFRTTVFGLGWPAPHRTASGRGERRDQAQAPLLRLPAPRLPVFSPIAPTVGMPDSAVDRAALYAGERCCGSRL